ncbi:MAG: MFS transporter [archaeon]
MDRKSLLLANIWKIKLMQALLGCFFIVPIVVLFWQDNGLNIFDITVLQSLFSLAVVILEIPTGYFADLFGRKKTLVLSGIFMTAGIIVYSLGHNFIEFLAAEILLAFGISLLSGADSALLYDTLKELKRTEEFNKIYGRSVFFNLSALTLANIAGGLIAKFDLRLTFYLTIPFFALLIPVNLSLVEPKRRNIIHGKEYVRTLLNILKYTYKTKKLRHLITYYGIIFGFNGAILWLYQPYLKIIGIDIALFGFVFALFQLTAAISSNYSHVIEKTFGMKKSLTAMVIIVSASYFLMGNIIFPLGFLFALLQQFTRGYSKTVFSDYVNKLTGSEKRATVLSIQNLFARVMYAIIIPIIGFTAEKTSVIAAINILGIATLVFGGAFLFVLKKDKII